MKQSCNGPTEPTTDQEGHIFRMLIKKTYPEPELKVSHSPVVTPNTWLRTLSRLERNLAAPPPKKMLRPTYPNMSEITIALFQDPFTLGNAHSVEVLVRSTSFRSGSDGDGGGAVVPVELFGDPSGDANGDGV